jgi:mannose-6-phosphate isomerase-like protein (cupin superfamily)
VPDHAPSTSNPLEVPDERFAVQARLGDSDRDFVLLRGSVTPGLSLSLCSHSDPGCLFVIDGELKVWRKDAPGERKTLGADEAILIGPDTRYAARVPGSASVNLLMVATARNVRTFATVG